MVLKGKTQSIVIWNIFFPKIIERLSSHVNPDFEIPYRKLGPNKKGTLFKMRQAWSSEELINLWPSTS